MKLLKSKKVRNCVLIALVAYAVIFQVVKTTEWGKCCENRWCGIFFDLIPEALGGALTYYLIDRLIGRQETIEDLITELGSDDNATANNAARKLQANGWITGRHLGRSKI